MHNITDTDTVVSVRDAGWHGLAKVYDDYPSIDEVLADAFPWNPVKQTIYRMEPGFDEITGEPTETFIPIAGHEAVVRDDNSETLGVVSEGLELVTHRDMFDVLEALEASARQDKDMPVKIETAGSLKGGRKVWALARLEEPLGVPGDPKGATIPYYAIQNAHDGSGSFRGQATMVRIICDNTAQASDLDSRARGTEFTFRHTKKIKERIEDAKLALAGWKEGLRFWSEMAEHLSSVKVTQEQRTEFIEQFIPLPVQESAVSDRVRNNVLTARNELRDLFNGPTLDYIELTAYGMLQGAIEWNQHMRNTKGKTDRDRAENRFKRAYLDKSETTRMAMSLIEDIVHV